MVPGRILMWMNLYVYMCAYLHVHVCIGVRVSLAWSSLCMWASRSGSPRNLFLSAPQLGDCDCLPPCLSFFMWVLRLELGSSCVHSKHFPNWAIYSVPYLDELDTNCLNNIWNHVFLIYFLSSIWYYSPKRYYGTPMQWALCSMRFLNPGSICCTVLIKLNDQISKYPQCLYS